MTRSLSISFQQPLDKPDSFPLIASPNIGLQAVVSMDFTVVPFHGEARNEQTRVDKDRDRDDEER